MRDPQAIKVKEEKRTIIFNLTIEELKPVFYMLFSVIIGLIFMYVDETKSTTPNLFEKSAVYFYRTSFAIAMSIFISLFITSKIGEAERKRHAERLESIQEGLNKNVFETLFKRIVPDEIFQTVKTDVILSEVCRNDFNLRYEFSEKRNGAIVLIERAEYTLLNITQKDLIFQIPLSDRYNSRLISAQCEINEVIDRFDSSEKNRLSENVELKHEGSNEIVMDAHIPSEKTAKIVTVFKKTYSRYHTKHITQEYFFKHPTLKASVEILFPKNYEFELPDQLVPQLKLKEATETRRTFQFKKSVLPFFGFVFSIRKKSEPVQNMEALGLITSNMIHNFNNQIHVMMGTLELAYLDQGNAEKFKGALDKVKTNLERFKGTVTTLNHYTEQSKSGGEPLSFSIEINEAIKSTMPKSSVEIIPVFEATHDIIFVNSIQLKFIIINLILKLSELKDENNCCLELNLTNVQVNSRQWVQLKITRNNCSKNQLICKEISDELSNAKDNIDRIDLIDVKEEVLKWDGLLTFKETENGTPCFYLKFPVIDTQFHSESFDFEISAANHGKNQHILFVDDDPTVSDITKASLEKLGYKVIRFFSSELALIEFSKNQNAYDLVITDTNMPNISGLSLGRQIKAIRPNIPVIISSGGDDRINPEKAAEMGFEKYLSKPYSTSEIAKAIKGILTN